jgi:hypothetical protein
VAALRASRSFVWLVLTTLALAIVAWANDAKWYEYAFKFLPGGQVAQAFNGQGRVVGTILMMSGELQVVTSPGSDGGQAEEVLCGLEGLYTPFINSATVIWNPLASTSSMGRQTFFLPLSISEM